MDDILSLDICKYIEWELEISKITDIDDRVYIMFGFVQHPKEKSIKKWFHHFGQDEKTHSKQFGIYIASLYDNFKTYGGPNRNHIDIGSNETDEWKEGDRFAMIVNFETKEIMLRYNDKDIGVIHKNIPSQLVPAISIYTGVELKCTKYELKQ